MPLADPIRERSFYRYGSLKAAHKPVHVWVGRIDEPADLGGTAEEPVASCIVMSMREGMPRLGHAPFYLSAMLIDPHEVIAPFDLSEFHFAEKYRDWRRAWDDGSGGAWEIGPAEAYANAIRSLVQRGQH